MGRNESDLSPRERRRKRRIRNQIIVYITTVLFVVGVIAGGAVAVVKISGMLKERQEIAKEIQEESEAESLAQETEPEIVISEPEPVIEETEPVVDPLDQIVDSCIEAMSLEDKVAGLFLISPEELTGVNAAVKAGNSTQEALNKYAIGGLVYSSKNVKSKEQFSEMLTTTETMSRYPIFLAVEELGGLNGTIAKSAIAVDETENMSAIAGSGDVNQAYEAGKAMGAYLTETGINMNLAPMADLKEGDTFFGTDSTNAANMLASFVTGLEETEISGCMRHFPGIGGADSDTEAGMVVVQATQDAMSSAEWLPFQSGIQAGVDFCMVSNISAPNLVGDNTPCSLSKSVVTEMLRDTLGFQGVVITDNFTDAAITDYYTPEDAAVKAIKAGADMIYMPQDFEKAYQGILDAVSTGSLSEDRINESLHRIYRIKYADKAKNVQ